MNRILIDTGVILDFLYDRKPFSDYATMIMDGCEKAHIEGYITPVIVSNVYYLLRRTASHTKVVEALRRLLTFVRIIPIDGQVVTQALHSDFKDFEDALQNFAAERSGTVDVIVTRNIKDFKNSGLSVLTPEDYIKIQNSGF